MSHSRVERWGMWLIVAGVLVWPVYVGLRLAGMAVDVETVLPFHLAGVIPGAILKRWSTWRRLWRRVR